MSNYAAQKEAKMYETNKEFAEKNPTFKNCCKAAKIEATKRQAGKFRRKTGLAWQMLKSKLVTK